MARTPTATLPVIALPKGAVLLPGVFQRVGVSSNRPDFASLLATVYTRAASKSLNGRIDTVPIACIPLASSLLGPGGQLLIEPSGRADEPRLSYFNPARAEKGDLFGWGVTAKITGVEGRGTGDFTLLVEGVGRLKLEKLYSDKPYLEGKVTLYQDEGTDTHDVLE